MWPFHRHSPAGPPEQAKLASQPANAELRKWFAKVDKDGSGLISVTELQEALAEGGMSFSLGTVAAIIRQCDQGGTGNISLAEFEKLHVLLESVEKTFKALRRDSAGRAPKEEVARSVTEAGYKLDRAVFDAIFNRFDPLRSTTMGLQEFLIFTLFLRSAGTTFRAFDPNGTGMVHLSFEQFLYAAVNAM